MTNTATFVAPLKCQGINKFISTYNKGEKYYIIINKKSL